MTLIERLEAAVARMESLAATSPLSAGEKMRFYEPVAVLLPDGQVKVHHWQQFQPVDWHTSDDWCEVMSQDEYRDWLERSKGIAFA